MMKITFNPDDAKKPRIALSNQTLSANRFFARALNTPEFVTFTLDLHEATLTIRPASEDNPDAVAFKKRQRKDGTVRWQSPTLLQFIASNLKISLPSKSTPLPYELRRDENNDPQAMIVNLSSLRQ